jgi:hypothetical protein
MKPGRALMARRLGTALVDIRSLVGDHRGHRAAAFPLTTLPVLRLGFRLAGIFCLLVGCSRPLPQDALLVTQTPNEPVDSPARSTLDVLYPIGTRIALVSDSSAGAKSVRVLSSGLIAAGEPRVSYDGLRIVFSGKRTSEGDWQIYETRTTGGTIKCLTTAAGGAMNPALLGDGSLLYVSPVPATNERAGTVPSALYVQPRNGIARQLSFSSVNISSPTVLSDGRIMFVSSQPMGAGATWLSLKGGGQSAEPLPENGQALYTINNDGTEVSAYAGQHDRPAAIRRPRQLPDGRIVFLSDNQAEFVASARPFNSRASLLPGAPGRVCSVEPALNGDLLLCSNTSRGSNECFGTTTLFRISAPGNFAPLLIDSNWNTIEAVPAAASRRPMGRLSIVDLSRSTGQILCLNANYTTHRSSAASSNTARSIRIFTTGEPGKEVRLGEVEVQADGSFMAEVPADVPLGFEAVDATGTVLRHVEPLVWVRPGENRSCVGCHEPHNHSPHNARPLAVRMPVPKLIGNHVSVARAAN